MRFDLATPDDAALCDTPLMVRPAVRRPSSAPLDPAAPVLGRIGSLEVRLARSPAEIRAAQKLRYEVFYEEMQAKASPEQRIRRLDRDRFDRVCDHLLVIDREDPSAKGRIVGTYRLLPQERAASVGGFYTASEFRIGDLVGRHPTKRFLELGRSCVLKAYRGRRTVELLWQGIWAYVTANRVDVLFGCASLNGTDSGALAEPLAFLRENAPPPAEWRVDAVAGRGAPRSSVTPLVDPRRALAALPPLIKGYLRLGGYIGLDAVVDPQFNTTDVLVVLPVERIHPRYVTHYGSDADRFAA